METRRGRVRGHGEQVALTLLVGYALALAFLLGPAIRGALATEGQPGIDFAGPPAAPAKNAAGVEAPPAVPGLAVAETADPAAAIARQLPELSSVDAVRATAILESDARFAAIVGNTPYTIARVGPWTTSNGPWTETKVPKLLGASFVVTFDDAIRIAGKTMPGALYDVTERRTPPYQEVDFRVDATGVTNLMVLVDLEREKVVNISPGLGSRVQRMTPPAGFRREVPNLSNEYPNPAERPTAPDGGER